MDIGTKFNYFENINQREIELIYTKARNLALCNYSDAMQKSLDEQRTYFNANKLKAVHAQVENASLETFIRQWNLGDQDIISNYKRKLKMDIDTKFNYFENINQRKIECVYTKARNLALCNYSDAMQKSLDEQKSYFDDFDLQEVQAKAENASLEMFFRQWNLGDSDIISKYKRKLKIDVDAEFKCFTDVNEKKKESFYTDALNHALCNYCDEMQRSLYKVKTYFNDIHLQEVHAVVKDASLEMIGIQQEYALGKYLRERYRPLLENKGYSKDLVYIQSTDLDRTLMSAAAVMAGLFPPEGDEIWNPELMWQPAPIHTVPKDLDYLLYGGKSCPRYDLALNNYLKSPEMTALYEKDKHLFQYLGEYSGMKIENYFDLQDLHDTLGIEEDRYKTLPEWTNSVFGPGTEFECGANYAFQIPAATPELARLSSGFLIGDIFGRCNQKVKGTLETNRSLWIYSAHDSTIANLLCSFGKFYPFPPPYASSLHFDLYKCKDNNYLQITYRHSTIETVLNFRKCGSKCSIEDLCKMYKKIIPNKSFDEECQLPTYSKANPNGKIMVICLGLAVPIVFISSWLIFSRMRGIEMKSDVMK